MTDNRNLLTFVTVSLDTQIKLYSFEGELEGETLGDGQIITATTVPGKRDYFLVSTYNEESQMNLVSVYRKQKMLFRLGSSFESTVLDLKLAGNTLFMPHGTSLSQLDRIEIKGM